MTNISVTSIKKAISRHLEDSAQFTTQQKSDLQLTVRTIGQHHLDATQCSERL
jgi:DNA-binding PucR family transcriptional regulator